MSEWPGPGGLKTGPLRVVPERQPALKPPPVRLDQGAASETMRTAVHQGFVEPKMAAQASQVVVAPPASVTFHMVDPFVTAFKMGLGVCAAIVLTGTLILLLWVFVASALLAGIADGF